MSKIGDYVGRVMSSDLVENICLGVILVSLALGGGLQIYSTIKASNPNPPIYRDVNGDGIKDKIVQRVVRKQGIPFIKYNDLECEVLFGVEVNGKKLYLSKDQFEDIPSTNINRDGIIDSTEKSNLYKIVNKEITDFNIKN